MRENIELSTTICPDCGSSHIKIYTEYCDVEKIYLFSPHCQRCFLIGDFHKTKEQALDSWIDVFDCW